jgi:hypothetical protein
MNDCPPFRLIVLVELFGSLAHVVSDRPFKHPAWDRIGDGLSLVFLGLSLSGRFY